MAFNYRLWWQKVKTFFWNWTPTWIKNTFSNTYQIKARLGFLKQQDNPLAYAAEYGYPTDIKLLIQKGYKIKDTKGLLHAACHNKNHPENITTLLNAGANIEEKLNDATPLFEAIRYGTHFHTQRLIDRGANIEARNALEQTPLHFAAVNNKIEDIKVLLKKEADIEATELNDLTPLQLVEISGKPKESALLKRSADTTKTNNAEQYPVDLATNREIKDLLNQAKERQQMLAEDTWQGKVKNQSSSSKRNTDRGRG